MKGRPIARATAKGGAVALLYGSSVALLFVGEARLARVMVAGEFGTYQLARTLVPFLVAAALLSLDQIEAREYAARNVPPPPLRGRQLRPLAAASLLSSLFAVYGSVSLNIPWLTALALPLIVVALSASTLASAGLRAAGNYERAAAAQQAHRLLAGLAFILASMSLTSAGRALWVWALCAAAVGLLSFHWLGSVNGTSLKADEYRRYRRLGVAFSLSTLTLTLTDWLDGALLLHRSASLATVGEYSLAKLFILYPAVSAASILGFMALPEIARRKSKLTVRAFRQWLFIGGIASLVLGIAVTAASSRVLETLYAASPSTSAIMLLGGAGAARLWYVIPSGVLGALAVRKELLIFGVACVIAVGVQVVASLSPFLDAVTAVSCGVLAGTVTRVVASVIVAQRAIQRKQAAGVAAE